MNISEIPAGSVLTIIASKDKKSIELKTTVKSAYSKNLLVNTITNAKKQPVSLAIADLKISVIYLNKNRRPIIWKNVAIKHIAIEGQSFHRIIQSAPGVETERRKSPRIFTGEDAVIRIGLSQKNINVRIKDISYSGISFVSEGNVDFEGTLLHILFKNNQTTVNVAANVIRKQPLKSGASYLYGCVIVDPASNADLNQYLLDIKKKDKA